MTECAERVAQHGLIISRPRGSAGPDEIYRSLIGCSNSALHGIASVCAESRLCGEARERSGRILTRILSKPASANTPDAAASNTLHVVQSPLWITTRRPGANYTRLLTTKAQVPDTTENKYALHSWVQRANTTADQRSPP